MLPHCHQSGDTAHNTAQPFRWGRSQSPASVYVRCYRGKVHNKEINIVFGTDERGLNIEVALPLDGYNYVFRVKVKPIVSAVFTWLRPGDEASGLVIRYFKKPPKWGFFVTTSSLSG